MSHFSLPSFRCVPSCPRCGRRLHRHGARRWFCPHCRRACRLRHRKRGPKRRLRGLLPTTVERFLAGRHSVRSLRARGHRSYGATHVRLHRGLRRLRRRLPPPVVPSRGALLVVADALWLWISGERVTIYVILLRPVRGGTATVAVVLTRAEWECAEGWRAAFLQLPASARSRVRGATIDEHTGLRNAIRELCDPDLPIQWCQFHGVSQLLHKLGKKMVKRDPVTAAVWETARRILAEPRAPARAGLLSAPPSARTSSRRSTADPESHPVVPSAGPEGDRVLPVSATAHARDHGECGGSVQAAPPVAHPRSSSLTQAPARPLRTLSPPSPCGAVRSKIPPKYVIRTK